MIIVKNKWYKIREITFLVLLGAEITFSLLLRTTINWNTSVEAVVATFTLFYIPVLVGLLYVADVLMTGVRNNIKKIVIDGFIGIFFVIAAYASAEFYLLATGVFLVSSDKASIKNIAKVIAVSMFFTTVIVGGLSVAGVIEDRLYDRFGRIAHGFGFRWYNFPARQLLFAWLSYLYVRGKKVHLLEIAVHIAVIFAVQYFTTSRLTFIIFLVALAMYIVFVKYEWIKINNMFFKVCTIIGFTVCGIVSIIASYFYSPDNAILAKINSALNGRIFLGREAFNRYDVNFFGQIVTVSNTDPNGFFYIDCGYLEVLFKFGIIIFAVTTVLYTVIHWYSVHKNDTMLFVWMTSVMAYTLIDNVWINPIGAGTSIIVFGAILSNIRKEMLSSGNLTE